LVLKKLFYIIAGIVLLSVSMYFAAIVTYLFSIEILPALKNGSFYVETSSMILNVLWEGNEIYALLAAYTLLAGGLAYGAVRVFMKAISRR
jgi:hypothetical protein